MPMGLNGQDLGSTGPEDPAVLAAAGIEVAPTCGVQQAAAEEVEVVEAAREIQVLASGHLEEVAAVEGEEERERLETRAHQG